MNGAGTRRQFIAQAARLSSRAAFVRHRTAAQTLTRCKLSCYSAPPDAGLANGTDTVTFADGSSLSLGGQTWDQLSVDDVFFIV
jgi:hypothetical protein